jgi:hypothetical protein
MNAAPLASDVVGLTKVAPVWRWGRMAWFKTCKVLG